MISPNLVDFLVPYLDLLVTVQFIAWYCQIR